MHVYKRVGKCAVYKHAGVDIYTYAHERLYISAAVNASLRVSRPHTRTGSETTRAWGGIGIHEHVGAVGAVFVQSV